MSLCFQTPEISPMVISCIPSQSGQKKRKKKVSSCLVFEQDQTLSRDSSTSSLRGVGHSHQGEGSEEKVAKKKKKRLHPSPSQLPLEVIKDLEHTLRVILQRPGVRTTLQWLRAADSGESIGSFLGTSQIAELSCLWMLQRTPLR